jgi:hypothetical protein
LLSYPQHVNGRIKSGNTGVKASAEGKTEKIKKVEVALAG